MIDRGGFNARRGHSRYLRVQPRGTPARGPACPVCAFDMEVSAIRRDVAHSAADGLALLGGLEILDEVLRRADYLVVALPATATTRGLIGEGQLALMKRTAVLVNVARAEIVDERALYHALAGRLIAAAALDVWYRYPADAAPTLPARQPF